MVNVRPKKAEFFDENAGPKKAILAMLKVLKGLKKRLMTVQVLSKRCSATRKWSTVDEMRCSATRKWGTVDEMRCSALRVTVEEMRCSNFAKYCFFSYHA